MVLSRQSFPVGVSFPTGALGAHLGSELAVVRREGTDQFDIHMQPSLGKPTAIEQSTSMIVSEPIW